jgi:hypothetical protein
MKNLLFATIEDYFINTSSKDDNGSENNNERKENE